MAQLTDEARNAFVARLEAGLQQSYEHLVEKETKEGGSLICSVNGKITEVPAAELLLQLSKAS